MADWKIAFSRLENKIAEDDNEEIVKLLNQLILSSMELQMRQSFQKQNVQVLKQLAVKNIKDILDTSLQCSISNDVVIGTIKLLRNICAEVPENQRIICEKDDFICLVCDLIKCLCTSNKEYHQTEVTITEQLLLLKVAIQLLGNCCVNNEVSQETVWRLCYPDLFNLVLSDTKSTVVDYSCMIIHVCTENSPERRTNLFECFTEENYSSQCLRRQLITNILSSWKSADGCEWIVFILEALLKEHPIELLYNAMPNNSLSIALLNFAFRFDENEDSNPLSSTNVILQKRLDFLVLTFCDLVTKFLANWSKLMSDTSTGLLMTSSKMLVSVLEILCQCGSQKMSSLKLLQPKQVLMNSTIELLTALSEYDGSSSSARNITNLSRTNTANTTSFLHGVKRDLVQIIGNMCYKCRHNQDYMSDHTLLLLNQCSIDHTNPYITQWAVWAIRNICEDHPQNQEIISLLEKRGTSNLEEIQSKLGCEVEVDKFGKLKIKKNSAE